jgi:type I restriction enzyme M protein
VEFTDAVIQRIAQAYHRWRGTVFADSTDYADEAAFYYSATLAEVEKHGFVLTPGRYVGAVVEDDDDGAFGEKMQRLTAQLARQMTKGGRVGCENRSKP